MELRPGEIVAVIIALAIPVAVFAVVFTPGALGAVLEFLLDPGYRDWIFFGGAAVAFGVLAWRLYRRIRPRAKPSGVDDEPRAGPTRMPRV